MSKFKRFIVAADNHGELACPEAIKKILDFNKTWMIGTPTTPFTAGICSTSEASDEEQVLKIKRTV